jgi:site-specific DNA recombinase
MYTDRTDPTRKDEAKTRGGQRPGGKAMVLTMVTRRIATYERVSSDDQRQRRTILTQTDELAKQLQNEPGVRLVERYIDDGVSGTIPMVKRPAGRRLMEDAAKGLFDEVWVYKVDRLGRDDIDPLMVWRDLEVLGVKVHSVTEGISDRFMYSIHVALAAKERRSFLERSAAGMERIVKAGHFPGGISPLGYEVSGQKNDAQLVRSERIIWGNWTAADLLIQIYNWLGVNGWSCPLIAKYLNTLGVPTAYQHLPPGARRAERGTLLQTKWRAGRIRNMVILTVYKGIYQYGKRSKKQRGLWEAQVPRLVSDELWQAAQEALARNRVIAKNTPRHYLLTGLIKCGVCGKSYCAAHGRDNIVWWRCNGRMTSRYDSDTRCQSKMVKSTEIETIVWQDIERWLREPGDLLKELEAEQNQGEADAVIEAERATLEARLMDLEREKKGYHRQNAQGLLSDSELQDFLKELAESKAAIEKRLIELTPHDAKPEPLPSDLLQELRQRLDNGLSEEQRQEIARLLVKQITIRTNIDNGNRRCVAEVTYRFNGAVNYRTDRGSWLRPA